MTGSNPQNQPSPPPPPGQSIAQGLPQAQPIPRAQPIPQEPSDAARPVIVTEKPPGPVGVLPQEDKDEPPQEELSTFALRHAPPWLVSVIFHMLLMIVLAFILLAAPSKPPIVLETAWAEDLGDQLEYESPLTGNDDPTDEEPVITPEDLALVDDPLFAPPDVQIELSGTHATSPMDVAIGRALDGRQEGTKKQWLLGRYGGDATTQAAVELGLAWLAKNQNRKTGAWSLTGPYSGGLPTDFENQSAATAMALLALQGNGNTPDKGEYKKNVELGWKWMRDQQDDSGNFYHEGPRQRYYTQGMCAIAACELYGMTKDEQYREMAEKALQYCLDGQGDLGGWKYSPNSGSDVSVTGWILMAMQSARMAGLEVPDDNFRRAERFLDRVQANDGSRYRYERSDQPTLTMTAEGLLCRQYLGWKQDDQRLVDGIAWITEPANLVNYREGRDVYYWYYATQVAHHMEGEYWERWNGVMRQEVPKHQTKAGREAGSWDPMRPTEDEWQRFGGRLYVTCLSIYMLEVYYRHLPLYSDLYGMGGSI